MPAFSPYDWIEAYEALGDVESLTPTGMIIVIPAEDTPPAAESGRSFLKYGGPSRGVLKSYRAPLPALGLN